MAVNYVLSLAPYIASSAFGTQDRGFFGRKNPHAFLRRGSKAVFPMSQISGMLKNSVIYVEVGFAGQIDRPFIAAIPSFSHVAWRGASLEMTDGTIRRSTNNLQL
jgi:hypothetical protein